MIIAFIFYTLFSYFFISKRIINICTLSLIYILAGIYVGESTIKFSSQWVRFDDLSFFDESLFYLKTGYYILLLVFLFLQVIFKEGKLKKSNNINVEPLFSINVSWLLVLTLALPLYVVYLNIYFPVFQEKTFISKYFQDRLEDFIPFRPYYTLAINGLSTLLFLQINYFLFSYKKVSPIKLLLNKNFIKLVFITMSLFFTAKRGQLFFPVFISIISYLIYKRKSLRLAIVGSGFLIIAAISRNFSKLINGQFNLEDITMSLSTSFFVSVRELTRVLYFFESGSNSFLYGKTYIAGLFSFIPTSINSLKADYSYMRYTSIISNQNPDDFGGMRSTYLGEAYVNFGFLGVIICPIIFALIIYMFHLFIKKYTFNKFVYFLATLWIFKMVILPIYENGSSMFLFFLITVIFMVIPSLKISLKQDKLILQILFLNKRKNA
ncbi:O-antigen polymerase [Seonamhaeicola maritimus]|uniref:Oligosaccharide repeat unit polymerase n=1 Tax=Seonamhaeicola maritimus TaxID=2591822 RepID=A0A5C7GHU3_9FLAO|nr:O-antigen polymerase [Seonamhaeicola maritimus]TXG37154.1 oligosaccharide repeat unit polymerase [Seonamhaeicola maritimus]